MSIAICVRQEIAKFMQNNMQFYTVGFKKNKKVHNNGWFDTLNLFLKSLL